MKRGFGRGGYQKSVVLRSFHTGSFTLGNSRICKLCVMIFGMKLLYSFQFVLNIRNGIGATVTPVVPCNVIHFLEV